MIERYIIYHNTKLGEERDRYDDGEENKMLADLKSMGRAYYVYDRKEDKDYTYSQFKKKIEIRDNINLPKYAYHGCKSKMVMNNIINNGFNTKSVFLSEDIYDANGYGNFLIKVDISNLNLKFISNKDMKDDWYNRNKYKDYDGIAYNYGDRATQFEIYNIDKLNNNEKLYIGNLKIKNFDSIKKIGDYKKMNNRKLRKDSMRMKDVDWELMRKLKKVSYDELEKAVLKVVPKRQINAYFRDRNGDLNITIPDIANRLESTTKEKLLKVLNIKDSTRDSIKHNSKRNYIKNEPIRKDSKAMINRRLRKDSLNKKVRQDEYYSRKENEINRLIGGRGFEMSNGDYLGVELHNGSLIAGFIGNWGLSNDYSIEYDFDLSLDENLQDLYDEIVNSGDYEY